MADPRRDRAIISRISSWFATSARSLPWRDAPPGERDPYRALVAELMLQQTQVARVIERFGTFVERFPTAADLARADERDVLALWSGLGYYRRAKALHASAKSITDDHDGEFPTDPKAIRALPGVGRYTAGAVASIALGQPEPIVDGNVTRVMLRLDLPEHAAPDAETPLCERDPSDRPVQNWAWSRAGDLATRAHDLQGREPDEVPGGVGGVNEGLMELGATVCTVRSPACARCPVSSLCRAKRAGRQGEVPRPKAGVARVPLFCASVLVRREDGRLLVERRGDEGMWAGLLQAPTLERDDRPPGEGELRDALGVDRLSRVDTFDHTTTHRAVRFDVWTGGPGDGPRRGAWMTREEVEGGALSSAQRRILLRTQAGQPSLF